MMIDVYEEVDTGRQSDNLFCGRFVIVIAVIAVIAVNPRFL